MPGSSLIEIENYEITLNRDLAVELLRGRLEREVAGSPNAAMSLMAKTAAVDAGLSTLDTIIQLASHHYRKKCEEVDPPHLRKLKTALDCEYVQHGDTAEYRRLARDLEVAMREGETA